MVTKHPPINKQIYQDLLAMIQSGQVKPGDTLPTEKELQNQYSVSRVPVRQALSKLETEGMIRRTPGRGTEVVHPRVAPWIRLSGFSHFYNSRADRVASRTISVQSMPADEEIASHFEIACGEPVLRIERLRLVDGEPTHYMHNFFALHGVGDDLPGARGAMYSLHHFIQQTFKQEESDVQEDLVAVGAPVDVAAMIQVEPGTPVLFVTRRGWSQSREPLEISHYWARTDKTSYRTYLQT